MHSSEERGETMAKKIVIWLFCLVLGGSFLVFNIFSRQLSGDNHENRLLTSLPEVFQGSLSGLPGRLDQFIADNSPFRYQLTALDAAIDYTLFGSSQSDQVLPGKDGWLFYKDGPDAAHPVANYQGLPETFDSEETLAAAAASLQNLSDTLARSGCTLVLDLAPSKDRVYREFMPDAYPVVNEENRTDRFAAYMTEHTTVAVSWPYAELRAEVLRRMEAGESNLYFKTDTHWNHAGALIGLDGALSAAGLDAVDFARYELGDNGIQTGDLANVAALYTVLPEERDLAALNYMELYQSDPRTVGVVGDSFSGYYVQYLEQRFAGCWYQAPETMTPELAAAPGCDVLIFSVTERNLDMLLGLLGQF